MNGKHLILRALLAAWAVALTPSTGQEQVFNHPSPSDMVHNLPTLAIAKQPQGCHLSAAAHGYNPAQGTAFRLLLKDGYFDLALISFSVSLPLWKTESGMSNRKLIAMVHNPCLAICG